jgi:curli biogenesis system outer membrane secretion channel CsgG
MTRIAASAGMAVGCLALVAGCLTPAQYVAMTPQNYAKSPTLDAKPTWRAAVLPPSAQLASARPAADALQDQAGMALMRNGRFTVVDRAVVEQLLEEQEFSYSGVVDPGKAVELGRLLGAEAVLTLNVTQVRHDDFWTDHPDQRDAELHAKLISVETGEVLYSALGAGSDFDGAEGALRAALEVALHGLSRQ